MPLANNPELQAETMKKLKLGPGFEEVEEQARKMAGMSLEDGKEEESKGDGKIVMTL